MPLFEYSCRTCDHQFEALVRGSDTPTCPSCHGSALQRRQSVFAARTAGASADLKERRGGVPVDGAPKPAGPCGACGDPRGPGACSMN
jgi:putative FmdB family regulatory protein